MSEILYFIQISRIFVGKSATFPAFLGIVPSARTIYPPLSVQKTVSLPRNHPSMSLTFFSILQQNRQNKATRSPFSGTVNARGDVLRVVSGRFAGQEYSFAVSLEYMALFCAL